MNTASDRTAIIQDKIFRLKRGLASDNLERPITHLKNGTGNPQGCLSSLISHSSNQGLLAWFEGHNNTALRQWFREVARLRRRYNEIESNTSGPVGKTWELLFPLVSNDPALIDWYAHFDANYDLKRAQDRRTFDFLAYHALVALRGNWALLESRCDAVIADPPKSSDHRWYHVDHHFYRALARGDEAGMRVAIHELLDPKVVRGRANDEGGFTEGLIFTPAVIYAKLAWRRGIRLQVDSPLVPAEWLPLDPAPPMASPFGV